MNLDDPDALELVQHDQLVAELRWYAAELRKANERLETAKRTAWVTAPVEAATIAAGDVIVSTDGTLRMVQWASQEDGHDAPPGMRKILTQHGIYAGESFHVRPDRQIPVLRRPTADALDILGRQLGAQPIT